MQYHMITAARVIARGMIAPGKHVAHAMRAIRFGREFEPLFHHGELMGWRAPGGKFYPAVGGGARDHDIITLNCEKAAASASTTTFYQGIPDTFVGGFLAEGFAWMYATTEANADNTLDWAQTYGVAGTGTNLFPNANANGLLDTGAPSTLFTNRRDAASGGAAAAAASTPTAVRIAAGQSIQTALTTAGTGTVPAISFYTIGHYV